MPSQSKPDAQVALDAIEENRRLRELLAQTKGSIRLLAEELEHGANPLHVARQLHDGADLLKAELAARENPDDDEPHYSPPWHEA